MAVAGQDLFQLLVTTTSSTAAYRDISQQVITFGGFNTEAILEQSDAFGDAWREFLYTGIRQMDDITVGGLFEDTATATGVHAIFGQATDLGAERECELNFRVAAGGTDVAKFDFLVKSYKRLPSRGALTRFEMVWTPTGAMTTAS